MRKSHLVILPGARSLTQIGALLLFLACPNIAFVGRDRRDIQPSCSFSTMGLKWLQKKPESQYSNIGDPGFLISAFETGEEMDFKWLINSQKCFMNLCGDNDTVSFQQVYTELLLSNESAVHADEMHTLLKELQELSVSQSIRNSEVFNLPKTVDEHRLKDHGMRQSRELITHTRRSVVLDDSTLKSNTMRAQRLPTERFERINFARKMSKDREIRVPAELNTRNKRYFMRDESVQRLNERRTLRLSKREIKPEMAIGSVLKEREVRRFRDVNTRNRQSSLRKDFVSEPNRERRQQVFTERQERKLSDDRKIRISRELTDRIIPSSFREDSELELNVRHNQRLSAERGEREIVNRHQSGEREIRQERNVDTRDRRSSLPLKSNFRRSQRLSVETRESVNSGRRVREDRETRIVRDLNTRYKESLFRDDSTLTKRQERENVGRRVSEGEIRELRDFNNGVRQYLFRDDPALELNTKRSQRLPTERRERETMYRRELNEQEIRQERVVNTPERQSSFREVFAAETNFRRTQRLSGEKRDLINSGRRVTEVRESVIARDLTTRMRRSLSREKSPLGREVRLSEETRSNEFIERRNSEGSRELRESNSRVRQNLFRDDSELELNARRTQRLQGERREQNILNRRESDEDEIRRVRDVNTRERQAPFRNLFALDSNLRRTQRLSGETREPINLDQRVTAEREIRLSKRQERENVGRRISKSKIMESRDLNIRFRKNVFRDDSALEMNERRIHRQPTERRERDIVLNSRQSYRIPVAQQDRVNEDSRLAQDREIRIARDLSNKVKRSLIPENSALNLSRMQKSRLTKEQSVRENVVRRVTDDKTKDLKDTDTRIRHTYFRDDSGLREDINTMYTQRLTAESRTHNIENLHESNEREIRQRRAENARDSQPSFRNVLDLNIRHTQRQLSEKREPVNSDRRMTAHHESRIVRDLSTRVKRTLYSTERDSEGKIREFTRIRQTSFRGDSTIELNTRHTRRLPSERREREIENRRESDEREIRQLRDVTNRERQATFRDVVALDSNFRRDQRLSGQNRETVNLARRVSVEREIRIERDLKPRYKELLFRDNSALSTRETRRSSEKRQERENLREVEIRDLRNLNNRLRQNKFRDDSGLELNARRILNHLESNEHEIRQTRNENIRERQTPFRDAFALDSNFRRSQRLSAENRELVNSGGRVTADRESKIARELSTQVKRELDTPVDRMARITSQSGKRQERVNVDRRVFENEVRVLRYLNTQFRQNLFRDDTALELNARRTFRLPTERREREIVNRRESDEREFRLVRDINTRERQSSSSDVFALDSIFRHSQRLSGGTRESVNSDRRVMKDRETRIVRNLNTQHRELLFRDDFAISGRQERNNLERRVSVGEVRELRDLSIRSRQNLFRNDPVFYLNVRRNQRLPTERKERKIVNHRESNEREIRQVRDVTSRKRLSLYGDLFALESIARRTQEQSGEIREPADSHRRVIKDRETRITWDSNTRYRKSLFHDDFVLSARQSQRLSENKEVRENVGRRVSKGEIVELRYLNSRFRQNLVHDDSARGLNTKDTKRQVTQRSEREIVNRRESNELKVREIRNVNFRERRTSFRDVFALDSNFKRTQGLPAEIRNDRTVESRMRRNHRLLAVRQEQLKLDRRSRQDREIRLLEERNTLFEQSLNRDASISGLNARRIDRINKDRRERQIENRRVAEDREMRIARELSTRSRRSLIHENYALDLDERQNIKLSEMRRELENVGERVSEDRVRKSRYLNTRVRQTLFREDSTSELNARRSQRLPSDVRESNNEFIRRVESQRKPEFVYDNHHINYVSWLPQKPSEGKSESTIDWATVIQILGSTLLIFLSANSNSKLSLMDKFGWTMKKRSQWTF